VEAEALFAGGRGADDRQVTAVPGDRLDRAPGNAPGNYEGFSISRALLPEVPSFVPSADFLEDLPPLTGTPARRRAQPLVLPLVAAAVLVGERAEHMR
jgi:hypothetical protein